MEIYFRDRLKQRADLGLERSRSLKENQPTRSFSHNDYLGLSDHPELKKAFAEGIHRYGFGSGASPLVSGYSYPHQACEAAFSEYRNRDRSLLFANGYLANLAMMQGLFDEKSVVFFDKGNHASLYDGAKLASLSLRRFHPETLSSLRQSLEAEKSPLKAVITETFFSTDGRAAALSTLIDQTQTSNAWLIADDAHGFGLFPLDYSQTELPLISTPLGKALGGFGGILSGSETLIETILQFSRPYLFSTAPPAAMAHALITGLTLIQTEHERRDRLFENVAYFQSEARAIGLSFKPSHHPIQSLILGDPQKALWLKSALAQKQFNVTIMRPPTVPLAKTLLRISLSARHTFPEIKALLTTLQILLHSQGNS